MTFRPLSTILSSPFASCTVHHDVQPRDSGAGVAYKTRGFGIAPTADNSYISNTSDHTMFGSRSSARRTHKPLLAPATATATTRRRSPVFVRRRPTTTRPVRKNRIVGLRAVRYLDCPVPSISTDHTPGHLQSPYFNCWPSQGPEGPSEHGRSAHSVSCQMTSMLRLTLQPFTWH